MTTTVKFERIGRDHRVPELVIEGDPDAQEIADRVYRYARRYLRSADYGVTVYEDGDVSIEGGRFGAGTIVREEP